LARFPAPGRLRPLGDRSLSLTSRPQAVSFSSFGAALDDRARFGGPALPAPGLGDAVSRSAPLAKGVLMAESPRPADQGLEAAFWRLFRDFFDRAEKRRRWSIRDDIPWDQVNPRLDPPVA